MQIIMFTRITAFALVLFLAACAQPIVTPEPPVQAAASRLQPAATPASPRGVALTDTLAPTATVISPLITPGASVLPQPSATPTGVIASATAITPTGVGLPEFSHVFIIVMENKESSGVFGSAAAPYINELAGEYAYADNYFGIRHPSLPNYLALTGGDTFGVTSDCTTCFVAADNIVNQMEHAGRTWKAYMESMPAPCYLGPDTRLYARKHNPFIYFNDVRTDPARCQKIVPFEQFQADLAANALPQYMWITPNLCNDTHDCPVGSGDDWLRTWVPQILASSAWQNNGVLFITFDEGDSNLGCCQYAGGGKISTLVISPLVKKGFVSHLPYDHYSLLRTIEQAWGLPLLNRAACDCSTPMLDFFH
jgi:phosphatidylinositol-3-phosphatase